MKNQKLNIFFTCILYIVHCIFFSSCHVYSFTGASISPDIKTVSVQFFPNRAPIVQPSLSNLFTEKLKDKLIIELQKNEEFIVNENQLLEAKVQERVEEINKQNILIDEQRHQTLLQNFEKEKAQIQMQALSSQMNPHFIFNCMNAIQHSILTNNTVKASSLLNDFALLIRMVLENSSQLKITLDDEIKLIDQYLKLEKNRLTEIFDYTIQIPSDVAVDFVKIPNMMLQPILENAIWHGFKNINYKGKLDVSFSVYDKLVTCEITDNGVGRKKSDTDTAVYKEQNSLAIEIIRKRMILINHTTSVSEASINFIDLTDDNNQPSGTKVILNLPIQ